MNMIVLRQNLAFYVYANYELPINIDVQITFKGRSGGLLLRLPLPVLHLFLNYLQTDF